MSNYVSLQHCMHVFIDTINVWSTYCWDLQMYIGKDEDRQKHPLGEQVVLTATEKLHGSGVGVTE